MDEDDPYFELVSKQFSGLNNVNSAVFSSLFGLRYATCVKIWSYISNNDAGVRGQHLLYVLHYFKNYISLASSAHFFKVCSKTYYKWYKRTLTLLEERLDTVSF